MIEEPTQVFYGFGMTKTEGKTHTSNLTTALQAAGINNPIKLVSFPADKNKIIVRLENLNELNETAKVNLRAVAEAYWNEANLKHPRALSSIDMVELTLSANMALSEQQERKIQWKSVDDDKHTYNELKDDDDDTKSFKPMQIRVFSISMSTEAKAEDLILV